MFFGLALLCYLLAWLPGALGFAALGVVSELWAHVSMFWTDPQADAATGELPSDVGP